MASPDWQRAKEVFGAALTRSSEERAAFLDEACGGDGELRREVDSLLAESLAMREGIVTRNPEDARAHDQLAYTFRARARLWRQAGDRAAARQDYMRALAIYTDLRARGYGGAYGGSELGVTQLALGEVSKEEGRQAEACQWFRRSAAVYGDLAARGAVLPNHREDAESARRAAAACGG